jgi:hypothetical protein
MMMKIKARKQNLNVNFQQIELSLCAKIDRSRHFRAACIAKINTATTIIIIIIVVI